MRRSSPFFCCRRWSVPRSAQQGQFSRRTAGLYNDSTSFHPSSTSLCPGEDWMNEPSAGKAPSLSLFVELTLVVSDQSCLALVSSDPSCGSIVSSSITVQSTLWESETLIIWKPPASQPESDSLVSEEEDEEDDEEESEEELLALRRDGCVFVSVAGFSGLFLGGFFPELS